MVATLAAEPPQPAPLAPAVPADPLPVPLARLESPIATDGLGAQFDLDGDWLASSGRAFGSPVLLYRRSVVDPSDWTARQVLTPGGTPASLALSGTTLAVGLAFVDEVEMYELTEGRWQLVQTLAGGGTGFGEHLALDGDVLAIGAGFRVCYLGAFNESVHVFERTPGVPDSWAPITVLLPPFSNTTTSFGVSLALRGDRLTVSSPSLSSFLCPARRPVHVFGRDIGGPQNWGEEVQLVPPPQGPSEFGEHLDQLGDLALIGDADGVSIYDRNGGGPNSWALTRIVEPDLFSGDIAFGGSRLYISHAWDTNASSNEVSVYERHLGGENAWAKAGTLPLPASQPPHLGAAMALNHGVGGVELAVWADEDLSDPDGVIYVYGTPRAGRSVTDLSGSTLRRE